MCNGATPSASPRRDPASYTQQTPRVLARNAASGSGEPGGRRAPGASDPTSSFRAAPPKVQEPSLLRAPSRRDTRDAMRTHRVSRVLNAGSGACLRRRSGSAPRRREDGVASARGEGRTRRRALRLGNPGPVRLRGAPWRCARPPGHPNPRAGRVGGADGTPPRRHRGAPRGGRRRGGWSPPRQ